MTVMIPNGRSTIPIPDASAAEFGSVVALKAVSLVAIVTVMSVVRMLSRAVALVMRAGREAEPGAGAEVDRRLLVLGAAAVADMVQLSKQSPLDEMTQRCSTGMALHSGDRHGVWSWLEPTGYFSHMNLKTFYAKL